MATADTPGIDARACVGNSDAASRAASTAASIPNRAPPAKSFAADVAPVAAGAAGADWGDIGAGGILELRPVDRLARDRIAALAGGEHFRERVGEVHQAPPQPGPPPPPGVR